MLKMRKINSINPQAYRLCSAAISLLLFLFLLDPYFSIKMAVSYQLHGDLPPAFPYRVASQQRQSYGSSLVGN